MEHLIAGYKKTRMNSKNYLHTTISLTVYKMITQNIKLTAIVMAINAAFLTPIAFAVEFDLEVENYEDVVTPTLNLDGQIASGIQIANDRDYLFEQGGELGQLSIRDDSTNVSFTTAKDSYLTFGIKSPGDGLEVSEANVEIIGGHIVVQTESTNKEDSALNVRNNGTISITAQSYKGIAGNESAFKVMSEFEGSGVKASVTLSNDFILQAGGTGIATESFNDCGPVDIDITARNIDIKTAMGSGYDRQGGIYAMAYEDNSGIVDIDLNATGYISSTGFKYGLAAYGDVNTFIQADKVLLIGDENNEDSKGLMYRGYYKDNSIVNIEAKQEVFIQGQAYGIHAYEAAKVNIAAQDIKVQSNQYGIRTTEFGITEINSDTFTLNGLNYAGCAQTASEILINVKKRLEINTAFDPSSIAFYASDEGTQIKVNKENKEVSTVIINGGIYSKNSALIDINLGQDSIFTGYTEIQSDGSINLDFQTNSTWKLSDNSTLSTLVIKNSLIDFSNYQSENVSSRGSRQYRSLTTNSFTGSENSFLMHIDLANESETNVLTDQFIITGSATGTNTATIAFDGSDVVNKTHSTNWLISQGAGSNMTVTAPDGGNQYAPNGGVSWWALKFVPENQNASDLTSDEWNALNNKGEGAGKWYLVQTEEPSQGGNAGHAPLPPEAEQIQNLGSSVAQAVGWLSEKNDLRRRLGEVRYGSQAGAWAKAFTRQDRAEGFRYNGFKQESTGIHIGYDTFASQNEHAAWLVGATFRYAHSKQEGIETAYGGDGKLNEYSGKVYATWMHESGSYMDILAQVGYYDQEINGLNNVGNGSFDADYHNWGYGASVEVGHMFTVSNGSDDRPWYNHWFIEPQLELSYFYVKGEDFKTSTGLKVEQGDADFLTGRAGLVVGKKVNYGTLNDLDKRWYQIGVIGGVTHEFLGDQTITFTGTEGKSAEVKGHGLGGTSFYYGVTADWQVSDSVRLYGEVSREEGEHYTKDYGVNVGFKYSF